MEKKEKKTYKKETYDYHCDMIDCFICFDILAYANNRVLEEKDDEIVLRVETGISLLRYRKHEIEEVEDGVYLVKLYEMFPSGKCWPVDISVLNENHQVKEIR